MRQLLDLFPKPSHYAGIEEGAVKKNPDSVKLRIALAFPDTYEIGMSYLGHKILYSIINANPDWWAERVMAPEREAAQILKARNAPLCALESNTPLGQMAVVGFAITHELCFTDVLHMLDLARIPLRSADRPDDLEKCPLILAGGGAMLGAEPLAPFIDLAALGDGEEIVPEILHLLEKARGQKWGRQRFLKEAAKIPGAYVPSLFRMDSEGGVVSLDPAHKPARRIVADLEDAPYPVDQVAPVGAIHNRLAVEIARGCTRGCRFCHAGIVYRPARERKPQTILKLIDESLDRTGFEELSFLALSAGDYSALKTLCAPAIARCGKNQVALSLPSLRAGSVDDGIMAQIASLRRTGCTIAPEAGSQRLRDVINKGITEEDLLAHARNLLRHGWRQVKLYFMIGLPTETDADLEEIANLCAKVRDAGGAGMPKLRVSAAISPFVPKPFTPFQWEAQISREEMGRRVGLLLTLFKKQKNLDLRWHDPDASFLEGLLSRGDRRLADVVEKAYRKGAIFCGWLESFTLKPWLEAFAECGVNPADYTGARDINSPLPWDHLSSGVSREFLLRERQRAMAGKTSPDCRYGACNQCGACDTGSRPSLLAGAGDHVNRLVLPRRDQANLSAAPATSQPAQSPATPKLNPLLAVKAAHYRVWHRKTGGFAFLSHLELQAALAKYSRRARLPVSFSQGFHPMPLISFGRALPVGVASHAEWFALTLWQALAPAEVLQRLNSVLPGDLQAHAVDQVDRNRKTVQSISETFMLQMGNPALMAQAAKRFEDFAKKTEFMLERKTKKGGRLENIRPLLVNWRALGDSAILFTTDWDSGYLSPLALALAIISPPDSASPPESIPRLIKTGQIFADGDSHGGEASIPTLP